MKRHQTQNSFEFTGSARWSESSNKKQVSFNVKSAKYEI